MNDWKAICKKLLFPPLWLIFLFVIFSAVALTAVFVKGWDTTTAVCVIYVFSFYTLTVLCLFFWKTFPEFYRCTKEKVYSNMYANRYFTDAAFKTHISLYASLAINLFYVATNAISAVMYNTIWFGIFAIYYAILAIMRFLLVRYFSCNSIGTSRFGELKRSRLCAYILMLVNIVLSGVVLMMVYYNRGFEYQGMLIYVMAMYTFYMTVSAIIDLIKYRKLGSPIMSASKVIKFTAALVSMLSLETAMFSQFGQDASPEMQRIMILATGGGIAVIVVIMAMYIIIRNTIEIKQIKKEHLYNE